MVERAGFDCRVISLHSESLEEVFSAAAIEARDTGLLIQDIVIDHDDNYGIWYLVIYYTGYRP